MNSNLLLRQHWVFDLDGTLTQPIHDFPDIRRQLGVPEGIGILEYIDQQPTPQKIILNRQLDKIETELAWQASANPGTVELLFALQQRGCKLGILTRNQRNCVDIVLQRIGVAQLFENQAIIACEDAPPKPDPEGIRRIMDFWCVGPNECVMVGDYLYDLQVGRAAGTATVHYAADRTERWPQLTDWVISELLELQVTDT
ncbi:MAG: HAD family hydrolase [Motiliproteus sp.]